MANSKQVIKRIRQAKTAYERNKQAKTKLRTYKKQAQQAVETNDLEKANVNFNIFVKLSGKAVSKKLIHKNTAARWVSRLNTQIKKIAQK